jgi:hypothetical protein
LGSKDKKLKTGDLAVNLMFEVVSDHSKSKLKTKDIGKIVLSNFVCKKQLATLNLAPTQAI